MKQIGRRHFLAISGGFTALATGSLSFTGKNVRANVKRQADKYLKRFTLDVGHRSNVSSSVVELKDGTLLWATTDPEPTNRVSRSISRITLRRSADGGRSWDHDQILAKGDAQFSVYSFAINRLLSGKLLHIFSRSAGYDTVSGDPQRSLREIHIHHSDDSGKTWENPIKVDTGERYHGDCLSMEQLPDGRIVFPFSYLTNVNSQFAVSAIYSDDDGYTWKRSKA